MLNSTTKRANMQKLMKKKRVKILSTNCSCCWSTMGSFSIFISLYMAKSSVHKKKTLSALLSLPFGVIAEQKGGKIFPIELLVKSTTQKNTNWRFLELKDKRTATYRTQENRKKTRIKQRHFLIIIVVSAFVGFSPSRGYLWALSAVHAAQHNCRTHNLFKTMRWSLAYADENLFFWCFVFSWCFRRTSPNNSIRFLSKTC